MRRPIPIISFIARQRDLRELVGEHVAGAANLNFLDQLQYFEGRFETIRMGDGNLPEIAAQRLLKPKDAEAKRLIDAKFEETIAVRQEVRDVLLTSKADPEAWRHLYPFSPALVDTLVAVSSLLQRERTALRILLQLLVDQRDTMQLGELVPVGDLYDQIARGDDAFSSDMKRHFQTADKLYRQNFKPMLEEARDLSFEEAETLERDDAKRIALRNDDRLIKTVLLAALAPEVETLRSLIPARLAALNHGTIKSRIPGREASMVLSRLEEWAGRVGQLKVEETTPPTISIQLTGVDVERIIDKAVTEDNFGNRLRCLKEILYKQLELEKPDTLLLEHGFVWRGTDRRCKVVFKNVWAADFDLLESDDGDWKLVIDYPMDEDPNRGPAADRHRLREYHDERGSTRTVVWLPSFFSQQALQDLGKLVKLEMILAENAYDRYVSDLSMQDKSTAKSILTNQRDALRSRMITHLQTVYGLREDRTGLVDQMRKLEGVEHFQSLDSGLQFRVPGATHLKDAMVELLDQALASQYPRHPVFDEGVKLTPAHVQRVLETFLAALQESEGRVEVERSRREMIRMIANPLKLGEMAPQYFVPGEHWKDHFRRKAPDGFDDVTVSDMRGWIDWGIPPILENLIILACAAQLNCSFTRLGAPYHRPTLKDLPNDCRMKPRELPSTEEWEAALRIQDSLLGRADLPKLLTAQALDDFSVKVREDASKFEQAVAQLASRLESEVTRQKLDETEFDRLQSTREAQRFLALVKANKGCELVRALAGFSSESPDEAISTSIKRTDTVLRALPIDRQTLDVALALDAPLKEEAKGLENDLIKGLRRNEYVTSLSDLVHEVNQEALRLLKQQIRESKPRVTAPPEPAAGDEPSNAEGESDEWQPPQAAVTAEPPSSAAPERVSMVEYPQAAVTAEPPSSVTWSGSDEAEVRAKYGNDQAALERNRQKVRALKKLYRQSQVEEDRLPAWVPETLAEEILEVHHVKPLGQGGEDERSNMIVITPTLHALLHAREDATIDLEKGLLSIPSAGIKQKIEKRPDHNG